MKKESDQIIADYSGALPRHDSSLNVGQEMKIALALLAVVGFTSIAFARSWPKWLPEHVSEVRFRDGVPGAQLRVVVDRSEIEKILATLRRAREVTKKEVTKKEVPARRWQVCVDFVGERPESGRWLLDLDTGDCTFLDPLIQPIYRIRNEDREMLTIYFRKTETETSHHRQRPGAGLPVVSELNRSAEKR